MPALTYYRSLLGPIISRHCQCVSTFCTERRVPGKQSLYPCTCTTTAHVVGALTSGQPALIGYAGRPSQSHLTKYLWHQAAEPDLSTVKDVDGVHAPALLYCHEADTCSHSPTNVALPSVAVVLSQEYMAGGTLKQLVTREMLGNGRKCYSNHDALDICLQMARGLRLAGAVNWLLIEPVLAAATGCMHTMLHCC
jgi:hypothetical protein